MCPIFRAIVSEFGQGYDMGPVPKPEADLTEKGRPSNFTKTELCALPRLNRPKKLDSRPPRKLTEYGTFVPLF